MVFGGRSVFVSEPGVGELMMGKLEVVIRSVEYIS